MQKIKALLQILAHMVPYEIDNKVVVEVGGADKGYRQIKSEPQGFIAADDIEMAVSKKIPLWA